MSDKPLTLEDLARAEASALKQREKARLAYAEAQVQLVKEMPDRYFAMARAIRDGVRRFNETAYKESGPHQRLIQYEESVAVTTREPGLGGELHVEVRRAPNRVSLILRSMWRPNRPDSFIIEGSGVVGLAPSQEKIDLRVDGVCSKDGAISFRTTCNKHSVDTPIDEIPERIVMVVVTGELSRLWIRPPWVDV